LLQVDGVNDVAGNDARGTDGDGNV
jgi:hypothetical protein